MASSGSSCSINSMSSPELLLDVSEVRATVEPTERGKKPLSLFPFQLQPALSRGESSAIECDDVLLDAKLLCVIVGDESGDGCSASVEW